jgi:hypothetical protein
MCMHDYTTGWISYRRQPLLDVPSHPLVPEMLIIYLEVGSITGKGSICIVSEMHAMYDTCVSSHQQTYIYSKWWLHGVLVEW